MTVVGAMLYAVRYSGLCQSGRTGLEFRATWLSEAAKSVTLRGRIIRARSPPFGTAHAVYLPYDEGFASTI
jgi:hypothetical protein